MLTLYQLIPDVDLLLALGPADLAPTLLTLARGSLQSAGFVPGAVTGDERLYGGSGLPPGGLFSELQAALNLIWKVPATANPGLSLAHFFKSRLLSLCVIFVIGFLLLVSLVISTALMAFSDYLDRTLPNSALILYLIHHALSFGFTTVFFAAIFKILPDHPVEWQDVWLGAALTALLFSLGKHLISLYIGSSNMASTYGAAGALIIVFVWVYYSAQIFLLGAEFAKAYGDQRRIDG